LGSKIAATLLRTSNIERTWAAFYWIYAILAVYYNCIFLAHFANVLRNYMPWLRLLDNPNCGVFMMGILLTILACIVLYTINAGPLWEAFPIRWAWQAVVS